MGVGSDVPDLTSLTIAEAARQLRSGALHSRDLTELALSRIEADNGRLNAFIAVTAPLAREQAARADEELASGIDRGRASGHSDLAEGSLRRRGAAHLRGIAGA